MASEAVRVGLLLGMGLCLPLWYLLNACPLAQSLGVVPKSGIALALASGAALVLLPAIGVIAARRSNVASAEQAGRAGMIAGLAAAIPIGLFLVPEAATLAFGIVPLMSEFEAAGAAGAGDVQAVANPVIVGALWGAPLFAVLVAASLALAGSLSAAVDHWARGFILRSRSLFGKQRGFELSSRL
ncbi:MAG: hypothetical protein HW416_2936 [Chloroflexi bacterium]|nr:hypothetical protein [Chloroflexota bacterium]